MDEQRDVERGTAARCAAAAAVLVSGLIHLQLYFDGFRDYPNANLGRSFAAQGVAAVVIAAALVARRHTLVRLAGIALLAGTLAASALSRTDTGVFGFTERGLEPSPQALIALVAEITGLVLLVATFVPAVGPGRDLDRAVVAPAAGAIVLAAVVGSVLWAQGGGEAVGEPAPSGQPATSGTSAITIAEFSFQPQSLEITAGTTVEWVNEDNFEHSVVAADGAFESPALPGGERFEFAFSEPGTYAYGCGIHPTMTATIVVTE